MKVTTYGTRGSLPVAGSKTVRYGGCTTSLRIESECLPPGMVLAVDAGSGFLPLVAGALKQGMREMVLLFTHYHYDHIQGLLIAPAIYIPTIPLHAYGPVQEGIGPGEMLRQVMRPPFHPVDAKRVLAHFHPYKMEDPATKVLIFHKEGGHRLMDVNQFDTMGDTPDAQVPFRKGKFPLRECLVVRMHYSRHPERTISYRFEERPTGKVFVFLTDEENRDGIPAELKKHVSGATLIIQDVQYARKTYDAGTSGFGHGTPDWAVRVAIAAGCRRAGFTHHDPASSDDDVDNIVDEGRTHAPDGLELFACADGMVLEV